MGVILWVTLLGVFSLAAVLKQEASGWGVNSHLDLADSPDEMQKVLSAIEPSNVIYLRLGIKQNLSMWPQQEKTLKLVQNSHHKVLGLIPYSFDLPPEKANDLRNVYAAARELGARAQTSVDVWENYNEPDVGFNPDAPDRSVAYMKAVYLGLKDSSSNSPPVLLSALGLPPGPWFDRAERNGLLSYGDAFNFHYYGGMEDFRDAIHLMQATQEQAKASGHLPQLLPMWVTEIGLNCVPLDHPEDSKARQRQALFFRETTRIASEAALAAFMPFAYRDTQEGFSLSDVMHQPYESWKTYVQSTRTLPLNSNPKWIDQSSTAPRVILQWLPAPSVSTPHKVSGTYRFINRATSITGELRIYSFASKPIHGLLQTSETPNHLITNLVAATSGIDLSPNHNSPDTSKKTWNLDLQPNEMKSLPVTFQPPANGYAASWFEARFIDLSSTHTQPSRLFFGLETTPRDEDFTAEPCHLTVPAHTPAGFDFHGIDDPYPYTVTSQAGPWLGINGLKISEDAAGDTFQLDQPSMLPGEPPMAIAKIHQLPDTGFIRLTANRPLGQDISVRVDLVDKLGQRFSIFENGGLDPSQTSPPVWLNLNDFHRYFWGHFISGKNFEPSAIREIQLRFYFKYLHDPVQLRLETMHTSEKS